MAKTSKTSKSKVVATITHGKAKRTNIPTAEYQAVMAEDDQNPIQVAYERRNPDLDPQLVWRGKDIQDWSDLVVQAPPLFIQENPIQGSGARKRRRRTGKARLRASQPSSTRTSTRNSSGAARTSRTGRIWWYRLPENRHSSSRRRFIRRC